MQKQFGRNTLIVNSLYLNSKHIHEYRIHDNIDTEFKVQNILYENTQNSW